MPPAEQFLQDAATFKLKGRISGAHRRSYGVRKVGRLTLQMGTISVEKVYL